MKLLFSILIILILLSFMKSNAKPLNPYSSSAPLPWRNSYLMVSLALLALLFYVNVMCRYEDESLPPVESFRFEVSPGKSSYTNCCGKGKHGLNAQFQYTSDIEMNRGPCPIPAPEVVEQDYKDVNTDFVMEGYSNAGCGCS